MCLNNGDAVDRPQDFGVSVIIGNCAHNWQPLEIHDGTDTEP